MSTWQSGDDLSVFSRNSAAAAGTSVSANVKYVTTDSGASADFVPDATGVEAANKYFAFYPYTATYASKLNADNDLGFAGAAAGASVTDYRFMPINVNSGATFEFDPATGESVSTNTKPSFYAVGDAPATPGDPIPLTFKPVLPLLELDLYGYGAFTQVEVMMTDKATDVFAQNNWLTGKGVLDLSTGQFKVTNYSNSAYHKLTVTLKEADKNYIELQGNTPMKMKLVTGHFNITKGLTLTFTKQGGGTVTKTIWADKTVTSKNAQGVAKHIRQGVNVPYVTASVASVSEFAAAGGAADAITINTNTSWSMQSKPDWISLDVTSGTEGGTNVVLTASANEGAARNGSVVFHTPEGADCTVAVSQAAVQIAAADYYSVDLSSIDFSSSYIYDVKGAGDVLIARITREYLGVTKNVRIRVAYPAPSGVPNYTAGTSLEDGCSVNAKTMDPTAVVYTAGSSLSLTTIWVSENGSQIYTSEPSGSIAAASVSPFVLVSPSGQNNALVKIGAWIWTAEGYKTTKLGDGTDITSIPATGTAPSSTDPNYCSTTVGTDAVWVYNALCVKNGLAPSGWSVPTIEQWQTILAAFLGGTSSYANMTTAGLFSRNCYKKPDANAPVSLGYYSTWSCEAGKTASTQWTMLTCKSDNAPGIANTQAYKQSLEMRLLQVIQ